MNQFIYYMVIAGAVGLFVLGGPLLDMLGWSYASAGASAITKIHPTTYLFTAAALLGLATFRARYWAIVRTPWFVLFLVATGIFTVRAALIAGTGTVGGGELSAALVNFVTPAMMLICFQVERSDLDRLGQALRGYFVLNSVMALVERLIDHRLVPSVLDTMNEHRSTALLGHPLAGALLTGLLIVHLATAPKRGVPIWLRVAELGLHALAMFAYGGRTALLFLPFVIAASAIFARRPAGEARVSIWQRVGPLLMIAAGVLLILLPIPFVEATLQRFTEDNGSADTRSAAMTLVTSLDTHSLMFGVDTYRRQELLDFYHTPLGIELNWVALTIIYGLAVTLVMAAALPTMLLGFSRRLDRSAKFMVLYFLIVTAGSVGFSVKSLLIPQLMVMMATLAQPRERTAARTRPRFDLAGAIDAAPPVAGAGADLGRVSG